MTRLLFFTLIALFSAMNFVDDNCVLQCLKAHTQVAFG